MTNHIFVYGFNPKAKRIMKRINAATSAFQRNKILLPLAQKPCVIIEIRKKPEYMPGLSNILIAYRLDIDSGNKAIPSFATPEEALLEATSICDEIKQTNINMLAAAKQLEERKTILLNEFNDNMIKIRHAEREQDDINHSYYSNRNIQIDNELVVIYNALTNL